MVILSTPVIIAIKENYNFTALLVYFHLYLGLSPSIKGLITADWRRFYIYKNLGTKQIAQFLPERYTAF